MLNTYHFGVAKNFVNDVNDCSYLSVSGPMGYAMVRIKGSVITIPVYGKYRMDHVVNGITYHCGEIDSLDYIEYYDYQNSCSGTTMIGQVDEILIETKYYRL